MKNLITFLLYCLSITAVIGQVAGQTRIDVVSKSTTETTMRLSLTGVNKVPVTTPKGSAFAINIQKGTQLLRAGAPDLPKYAVSLMIPATGNMAVDIIASEYQDYPGIDVAPSKGDFKRNINPDNVPFTYGTDYERDQFFPGALASLQDPFIMRDVRGQSVWIYPVQYNPVTKVLRVYSEITLKVRHIGGTGTNEAVSHPGRSISPTFRQLYQRQFLNYDEHFLGHTRGGQDPERMLIITKNTYVADLQPLVTWKKQSGIATEVVTTAQLGGTDPASVFNYVQNYYTQYGITYLLLVGDENAINPQLRADGANYSCDNCYGYMEGDDHLPEILVGRFNAATEDQVKIMVSRNLDYEKTPLADPTQNWCATGMASTSNLGQGIGDDGQADFEQGNEWKTKHLAAGYEKFWEFYDGDHADISPTPGDVSADQSGNPVNTELVQLMNTRGVSLYNYCGHGAEQVLVSGNFNTSAVATLRNIHRYPIIVAVACCAGNFTNNNGGDCLGEAVQRAGNAATGEAYGSIAGFFSSDFQSWAPPMSGQDGMNKYLIDASGVTSLPRMSAMLASGNAAMITEYGQAGITMADFWNPFAEPSTVPRTRLPLPLVATHDPSIYIGSTTLAVSCPVEGALIALYWQGQTLAVATVTGGVASFLFPPLTNVGDLTVTGTQFNYIPYQGNIAVKPASGPFVVNQALDLDDSATGNNNHAADFGETLRFNLSLGNVGLSLAEAASATLTTTDDNVIIIDGDETFGNIDVNATVVKPAAFTFSVHDDVLNGHIVNFTLHIAFGNGQGYDLPVAVQLQAPDLTVGGLTLADQVGGNGDNRMQSGELVYITIKNLNIGQSKSPSALGQLTSDSPWLTVSAPVVLGQIDPVSGTADAVFHVFVSAAAPPSVFANFHYKADAGNYGASKDFGPYSINAIIETFESNTYTNFPWELSGNKPWTIVGAGAYTGTYCSRSGTISNGQQSVMDVTLNFTSDGPVSFARKVSSEENYDFLQFLVDNVVVDEWSGTISWGEVSYPLTAGVHKLSWIYSKDQIGSAGSDRAWVDDIQLPPFEKIVATHNPDAAGFDAVLAPNPTSGWTWLKLDIPVDQHVAVQVYDCLGHLALTHNLSNRIASGVYTLDLDLSNLSAGMYFVQIKGDTGSKVLKVVKE